jgi:hypothetical protein
MQMLSPAQMAMDWCQRIKQFVQEIDEVMMVES